MDLDTRNLAKNLHVTTNVLERGYSPPIFFFFAIFYVPLEHYNAFETWHEFEYSDFKTGYKIEYLMSINNNICTPSTLHL